MVLQNLLRSGLEQPSPAGFLQEEQERQKEQNSGCVPSPEENLQWHPVPVPARDPESIPILCHRHRLAKWPPGLLDQALRLGLLELRRTCPSGAEDPVLVLAQKLGQLGEGREGLGEGDGVPLSPRCSCHSILAAGPVAPGDDPSDTSDALLVLEGLGSEQVGELAQGGGRDGGGDRTPRRKSRKGGSLKVRLSKLFRTKSSSGGSGGLLDKRPSLASSTSSGGSLLDVWGSTCSSTDQDRLQVSRPLSAFSPVPFTPAFTDTFLRGLPRPVPLRPDGQNPPPRLAPRCPLSRPDAGSFATSLRELEKCGWYWGPMNWEDAEMKLKGKPDGSFLVRDSSDPRYILSTTHTHTPHTTHTRMEHYRGTFSLWCHPKFEDRCHSVVEFIERAIMHSKNGKFLYFLRSRVPGLPPTPVQLLYPVSRFSSVKSLQHLCRFCIRQLVRIDHIQELPLPTPLIAYLRKFYYYDPEEEISAALPDGKGAREPSGQPGVRSQT
uniref:Suppressor of cytokine signaling 7 n=1 Tax=Poecilia reticulata TaxID=8081 RepID=A0A3P9P8G6_POERE